MDDPIDSLADNLDRIGDVTEAFEARYEQIADGLTGIQQGLEASRPPIPAPVQPWQDSGNVVPGATFRTVDPAAPPQRVTETVIERIPPTQTQRQRQSVSTSNRNAPQPPAETVADRASTRAAEVADIVAAVTGGSGGGRIPPVNGGGPPDPPDDNNDDGEQDDFLQRLYTMFQQFFGNAMPLQNMTNSIVNNASQVLGGNQAPQGPRSVISNLMQSFSNFYAGRNTPQQGPLTFRMRMAQTAARIARPAFRAANAIIPRRIRLAAARTGARAMRGVAGAIGVSPRVAARFGASVLPAALAGQVLATAIPIVGQVVRVVGRALTMLSNRAMETTMKLVDYSAPLAFANARMEFNNEIRKFRLAGNVGGLGAARIRMQDRIADEWLPIESKLTNFGNVIGIAVDGLTLFALKLTNVSERLALLIPGGPAVLNAIDLLGRGVGGGQQQPWQMWNEQFQEDNIAFQRRNAGPRPPVGGIR